MLKKPLAFLLAAAAIAAGGYLFVRSYSNDSPVESQEELAGHNAAAKETGDENTLDQSLKSISLSQGEGGFEIWRLKAEWANVMQQGDRILVEKPKLTYFDKGNEGKPLYVNSDRGDIEQKTQILRFVDNVRILQEDRQLDGELLIYNGTAKTMTFPEGARFTGADMSGKANHIVWRIDSKIILGTGGINVFFDRGQEDAAP